MAIDYGMLASGIRFETKRFRALDALATINNTYTLSNNPDINTHKQLQENSNDSFNDNDFERNINNIIQENLLSEITTIRSLRDNVSAEFDNFMNTVGKYALETAEINATTEELLEYLADSMADASEEVVANSVTVTAPSADGDNVGNGVIYASVLRPGWGDADTIDNEMIKDATITARVTNTDIGNGTADGAANIDIFIKDDEGNLIDGGPITVITDTSTNVTGTGLNTNIVSDSSFENEIASGAGGWSYSSGFALVSTADTAFLGSLCGKFSNGTSVAISQAWGTDDNNVLVPGQMLFGSFRCAAATSGASTGTVTMFLNGTNMAKTTIATANPTSTAYTEATGFARVPKTTGTDYSLYLSAAGANRDILVDCVRCAAPADLGGILWVATRGNVDFVEGDRWTGGSATNDENGKIQTFLRDTAGVQLPSEASASANFEEGDV